MVTAVPQSTWVMETVLEMKGNLFGSPPTPWRAFARSGGGWAESRGVECWGEEEAEPEGEGPVGGGGLRFVDDCCSQRVTLFIIWPDIGRRLLAADDIIMR